MSQKPTDVRDVPIENGNEKLSLKDVHEKVAGAGIDIVQPTEMERAVELEKFMNETVVVRITPARAEGELKVVVLNCNGVNQPIYRGSDQPIKRKYLEILARAKTETFEQDPERPLDSTLIKTTSYMYPYELVQDTEKGRAWHASIAAQAQ